MKRKIFLIALALVLCLGIMGLPQSQVLAQPPEYWAKTYGGTGNDWALSIQQTSDGGYIVAGWTNSFGAGGYDFWVLKLNSAGVVEWQKTYGGTGNDHALSIQQTSDGGYIVAGWTNSFGAGGYDFWVLKLDSGGDIAECPLIGDSTATVRNTSVVGPDTPVSGVDSTATTDDTSVTAADSDCSLDTQCYYSPPDSPPDCSEAYADPACLWPPNHKFVDISIMGVTDPDGDSVTITITGITSDEPTASDKGSGGATHAPDAKGVGTATASVRAERSGQGDGRVYEISFTASDGRGGECEGTVIVKVPHDQSHKTCSAIDSGQNYDATAIN